MADVAEDLIALLQRARRQLGTREFLAVGGETATGEQFVARVFATATALGRRGFRAGDRLAVHLHRCVDEAVAVLAAAVAGGIAVPINGKLKDDQVAHVLADCTPFAVVVSDVKASALHDARAVYGGRPLLCVGGPAPRGLAGDAFAALATDGAARAAVPPAIAPDMPAVLLYSSGSTGMSKGIVQDNRNLVRGAQIVAGYLDLTAADHILAVLPFSFDYGLNQLLSALASACRITAADYLGLAELAQLLATVRPTGLAGVPSLWHDVVRGLQNGAIATADGQSLRYATNSGGRLWPDDILELRRRWPHLRLFSMYGLTEAFRSAFLPPEEIDRRPTSFGKALPGVELLLVEPDTDRLLTGEATGELVHAGALVAQGYWRRPADTAARFRPDPRGVPGRVVYSGDLVRRDADGFLYFVARLDRMLKVSGHRISPDEVAVAVTGMVGVGEVAVFGVDGGAAGHRIVLCAAGDPADRDLPSRIQGQCRSRLPAYMVPAVVRVLPALPRNQNGKIDILRLEREVACTDAR